MPGSCPGVTLYWQDNPGCPKSVINFLDNPYNVLLTFSPSLSQCIRKFSEVCVSFKWIRFSFCAPTLHNYGHSFFSGGPTCIKDYQMTGYYKQRVNESHHSRRLGLMDPSPTPPVLHLSPAWRMPVSALHPVQRELLL